MFRPGFLSEPLRAALGIKRRFRLLYFFFFFFNFLLSFFPSLFFFSFPFLFFSFLFFSFLFFSFLSFLFFLSFFFFFLFFFFHFFSFSSTIFLPFFNRTLFFSFSFSSNPDASDFFRRMQQPQLGYPHGWRLATLKQIFAPSDLEFVDDNDSQKGKDKDKLDGYRKARSEEEDCVVMFPGFNASSSHAQNEVGKVFLKRKLKHVYSFFFFFFPPSLSQTCSAA